jgi:hypothetical protein
MQLCLFFVTRNRDAGTWEDGYRFSTGQAQRGPALFICFTANSDSSKEGRQVMTGGAGYVRYWTLTPPLTSVTTSLHGTAALCGAPITAFTNRDSITGCANGDLLLWHKGELVQTIAGAHAAAVYAVAVAWEDCYTVTGSSDGKVRVELSSTASMT